MSSYTSISPFDRSILEIKQLMDKYIELHNKQDQPTPKLAGFFRAIYELYLMPHTMHVKHIQIPVKEKLSQLLFVNRSKDFKIFYREQYALCCLLYECYQQDPTCCNKSEISGVMYTKRGLEEYSSEGFFEPSLEVKAPDATKYFIEKDVWHKFFVQLHMLAKDDLSSEKQKKLKKNLFRVAKNNPTYTASKQVIHLAFIYSTLRNFDIALKNKSPMSFTEISCTLLKFQQQITEVSNEWQAFAMQGDDCLEKNIAFFSNCGLDFIGASPFIILYGIIGRTHGVLEKKYQNVHSNLPQKELKAISRVWNSQAVLIEKTRQWVLVLQGINYSIMEDAANEKLLGILKKYLDIAQSVIRKVEDINKAKKNTTELINEDKKKKKNNSKKDRIKEKNSKPSLSVESISVTNNVIQEIPKSKKNSQEHDKNFERKINEMLCKVKELVLTDTNFYPKVQKLIDGLNSSNGDAYDKAMLSIVDIYIEYSEKKQSLASQLNILNQARDLCFKIKASNIELDESKQFMVQNLKTKIQSVGKELIKLEIVSELKPLIESDINALELSKRTHELEQKAKRYILDSKFESLISLAHLKSSISILKQVNSRKEFFSKAKNIHPRLKKVIDAYNESSGENNINAIQESYIQHGNQLFGKEPLDIFLDYFSKFYSIYNLNRKKFSKISDQKKIIELEIETLKSELSLFRPLQYCQSARDRVSNISSLIIVKKSELKRLATKRRSDKDFENLIKSENQSRRRKKKKLKDVSKKTSLSNTKQNKKVMDSKASSPSINVLPNASASFKDKSKGESSRDSLISLEKSQILPESLQEVSAYILEQVNGENASGTNIYLGGSAAAFLYRDDSPWESFNRDWDFYVIDKSIKPENRSAEELSGNGGNFKRSNRIKTLFTLKYHRNNELANQPIDVSFYSKIPTPDFTVSAIYLNCKTGTFYRHPLASSASYDSKEKVVKAINNHIFEDEQQAVLRILRLTHLYGHKGYRLDKETRMLFSENLKMLLKGYVDLILFKLGQYLSQKDNQENYINSLFELKVIETILGRQTTNISKNIDVGNFVTFVRRYSFYNHVSLAFLAACWSQSNSMENKATQNAPAFFKNSEKKQTDFQRLCEYANTFFAKDISTQRPQVSEESGLVSLNCK